MIPQNQYSESWFIACVTLGRQEKEVMEESYVIGNMCSWSYHWDIDLLFLFLANMGGQVSTTISVSCNAPFYSKSAVNCLKNYSVKWSRPLKPGTKMNFLFSEMHTSQVMQSQVAQMARGSVK